jgi:hypothetical protein
VAAVVPTGDRFEERPLPGMEADSSVPLAPKIRAPIILTEWMNCRVFKPFRSMRRVAPRPYVMHWFCMARSARGHARDHALPLALHALHGEKLLIFTISKYASSLTPRLSINTFQVQTPVSRDPSVAALVCDQGIADCRPFPFLPQITYCCVMQTPVPPAGAGRAEFVKEITWLLENAE